MRREICGFIGFLCLEWGVFLYSYRLSVVLAGIFLMAVAVMYPEPKKPGGREV
jgi:hypothetical protein